MAGNGSARDEAGDSLASVPMADFPGAQRPRSRVATAGDVSGRTPIPDDDAVLAPPHNERFDRAPTLGAAGVDAPARSRAARALTTPSRSR